MFGVLLKLGLIRVKTEGIPLLPLIRMAEYRAPSQSFKKVGSISLVIQTRRSLLPVQRFRLVGESGNEAIVELGATCSVATHIPDPVHLGSQELATLSHF